MSSWKRGFIEILAEILESLAASPLRRTQISVKCKLDSRAVSKYLSIAQMMGLVEKSKQQKNHFVITQKGINYRNQIQSVLSMVEKDLNNISGKHKTSQLRGMASA